MKAIVALPFMAALSSIGPAPSNTGPVQAPQKAQQPAPQVDTITCPLTGSPIPSCCCPVKK